MKSKVQKYSLIAKEMKALFLLKLLSRYCYSDCANKNSPPILVSILVLFYSQSLSAYHWSPFVGRFECPEITNAHECALSLEQKVNASFIRRVSKEKLEIVLLNGDIKSFVDRVDDPATVQIDEAVAYAVLEVIGESRYVVLSQQFGEGGAFSLLDRNSNVYYQLKGYPVFSPDDERLLVANTDFAAFSPTVLQIYKIMEGSIELEYQADLGEEWRADWGAESITWESSSVITFTVSTIDCAVNELFSCERKSLKYNGQDWEII